jgi:hypothetical protein
MSEWTRTAGRQRSARRHRQSNQLVGLTTNIGATLMQTKHTPLPWITDGQKIEGARPGSMYTICYLEGTPFHLRGTESAAANANFIVRACNSHETLLAALKALCDSPSASYSPTGLWSDAKLAIAKATS